MTPITLCRPRPEQLPAMEDLYTTSFPASERRAWAQVASGGDRPALLCIATPDVAVAGLVSLWRFPEFTYIEHLCTAEQLRGRGVGSSVLTWLRGEGKPLLLEVEPPCGEGSIEQRRIDFYRRCGFCLLDYDYEQPPYGPELPAVKLLLMSTDASMDAESAAKMLHRVVYAL